MAQPKKELNPFEKLNKTLGEYYHSQRVTTYYDDKTPNGKFLAYCEENGFELEDMDDELQNDAADCMYCDFDENFPIDKAKKIRNRHDRVEEIFHVIKYCYTYGVAPKYFSTLDLELSCDDEDMKSAEAKYTVQCPKIFKQENTLKEVFAIGLKNDFPFISYLVDAYQRDRMLSDGQDLSTAAWVKQSPYIKKIHSKSKKKANTIQSGIETYLKRVVPRFHWKAMNKIQDDIEPVIEYFVAAGQFVEALLAKGQTPPFGYDVVIVVKKAISTSTLVMPELSGSDDDDDDDENEFKIVDKEVDDGKYLDGVEDKLKDNNCAYFAQQVPASKRVARFLMNAFDELSEKLGEKYKKKGKNNIMDGYPRKKRFCTMIDRRGGDINDWMVMFEPPDDSNTLPDKHVPDWYFNAGKTCIVPSKGYNNGNIYNDGGESGVFDAQEILCVDRAYKGQVITISFHVDSSASVRCYLFWNGCYIRIVYAEDLKIILTAIFDVEYNENETYLNSAKSTDDMAKLKVVSDSTFAAFYKEVKINKK